MTFFTDYVAKGSGLIIAQQYCPAVFYIYPILKPFQQPCDVEITIKGPSGSIGHAVMPSKLQSATNYQRALYISGKLNSISPTVQGTSFFRKLALNHIKEELHDIPVKFKIFQTRAKISFIPQKSGIHDIHLVAQGVHVNGSPYSIPVEMGVEPDDSQSDEDIDEKKRIVDEKMLLNQDDTLAKLNKSGAPIITEDNSVPNMQKKILTQDIYHLPKPVLDSYSRNPNKNSEYGNDLITNSLKFDAEYNTNNNNPILLEKSKHLNANDWNDSRCKATANVDRNEIPDILEISNANNVTSVTLINNNSSLHSLEHNFTSEVNNLSKKKTPYTQNVHSPSSSHSNVNHLIQTYNSFEISKCEPKHKSGHPTNDPDLVKCHKQGISRHPTSAAISHSGIIRNNLTRYGINSMEYDKSQCYLKSLLKYELMLFSNKSSKLKIYHNLESGTELNMVSTKNYITTETFWLQPSSFVTKTEQFTTSYPRTRIVQDKMKIFEQFASNETIQDTNFNPHMKQNWPENPINRLLQTVKISSINSDLTELNTSVIHKAKFNRAKQFFQNLEGSLPIDDYKTDIETCPKMQYSVQRSDSAPSLDQNLKMASIDKLNMIGGSMRITDRFLVDDLFKDILGDDDKRFFGIPNKMAVVASLASIHSSRNITDSTYGSIEKLPRKASQGFYKEYPHLPKTDRKLFRPRSNITEAGLIPRRLLLVKSMANLNI